MKTTQITEKMPGFVKETIGQAQKRLTLIEGEARKFITGTWTMVRENDSLKIVEQTIKSLTEQYNETMDVDKIKKQAEDISNEYTIKAFHTVGIATRTDIKQVERKIDKLRSDIRKLNRRGGSKAKTKTAPKTRTDPKTRTAPNSNRSSRTRRTRGASK
jgi:SUMO ligase MMS21 Smc5/6 complex component